MSPRDAGGEGDEDDSVSDGGGVDGGYTVEEKLNALQGLSQLCECILGDWNVWFRLY